MLSALLQSTRVPPLIVGEISLVPVLSYFYSFSFYQF